MATATNITAIQSSDRAVWHKTRGARLSRSLTVAVPLLGILAVYAACLFYARDRAPFGLNNDVAEEALRGLRLIAQGRIEPITFILGNSAETLYLYFIGFVALLTGPTTLAIQLAAWFFAIGCLALTVAVTRRLSRKTPVWVPALLGASSLWLFHFARSGLRTICAPVFLVAFALALDRAERSRGKAWWALLCGGILGLSVYGYTSCRTMVFAFAGYAAYRLIREKSERRAALRCYGFIAAGFLVASIPNLLWFIDSPSDLLSRGAYVLPAGGMKLFENVIWSVLFPFHYPAQYLILSGPDFQSDGVSWGFLAAGFRPISPLLAILAIYGAWRSRSRPGSAILISTWVATVLSVGLGGPSPTRLLILLPVFLVFASAGIGDVLQQRPKFAWAAYIGLILLCFFNIDRYLSSPQAPLSLAYGGNATLIGKAARRAAMSGRNVICVVKSDANVVRYLTFGYEKRVKVVEFYRRPPVRSEIPADDGNTMLLIENTPEFRDLIQTMRGAEKNVEVAAVAR